MVLAGPRGQGFNGTSLTDRPDAPGVENRKLADFPSLEIQDDVSSNS
jgi:hypothetical protein